ncbi:MAG: CHAD domain-containing protein [Bauldia sp.]
MAHRLGKNEEPAKALLRLTLVDLTQAARDFRNAASREERVHRVRQRLKRVRTILRVLEPAYGERVVAIRRDLSETARLLAGTRDADVAAASARDLATTVPDDDLGLSRVVSTLDEEAARAHHEHTPIGEVNRRLAAAIAAISTFGDEYDGDALMTQALRRTYAKGRRVMERARSSLSTPDLHRWRKLVKQLWYLLRLDRKRLPKHATKVAPDLERLGEVLGQDNDHALLAEKLALSPTGDFSLMSQLSLIAKRRNALEAEAFELGAKIFKRRPEGFMGRLKR